MPAASGQARAFAVAASGGRDSTALLHCAARTAREFGLQVHALHVHHGLMPQADAWLLQVRAQCRRWARAGLPVTFHAERLLGAPEPGDSVEAWARRERYRALGRLARQAGCSLVLLAHHRRDQAETLLLQALRGGGPAGLAAMPASAVRDGITWARPWLAQPREAVEAYVRRHRLRFVDDASNADPRFARSRLRQQLWPALSAAFPDAEAQLAAAALRAAEAAACGTEQAQADLALSCEGAALVVERWRALSGPRQRQCLRAWLRRVAPAAPETLVQRLARELPGAASGRWPAPGAELRLFRGRLVALQGAAACAPVGAPTVLDLRTLGRHPVPGWPGGLVVREVAQGGVDPARLARVAVRAREGGERFQRHPGSPPRSLKKQFQALAVPEWLRQGPLLYDDGQLLFVPGLGVDARALAAAGRPQLALSWEAGPDGAG